MVRYCFLLGSACLLLGSATPPPRASAGAQAVRLAQGAPAAVAAPVEAVPASVLLDAAPLEAAAAPEPVPAAPPAAEAAVVEEGWSAPPAPADPNGVRIVVSIPLQKAYVFEDGDLLWTAPVSTGRRGHETPTGTFPILQKKVHHRSSKYDDAPMPYMQRLTWYGIALHAGRVPGYPASHGCIRLPRKYAKLLYDITDFGTVVTITRQRPEDAEEALQLA